MASNTKLLFTLPNGAQQKYLLSRDGTYHIGTAERCDISLDDSALEENHGKLVADETNEARWFLKVFKEGSIIFLEDGTEHQLGNTHIQVSVIEVEDVEETGEEADAPAAAILDTDEAPTDNQSQLEELKKVQQGHEIKSAIIMIILCGILAFAAGVAWRIIKGA